MASEKRTKAHPVRELQIPLLGDPETQARFWSKVEKTETCWLWTKHKMPNGYARFWVDGIQVYAHRFSFALMHGQIAEGLTVDHACRVRHCVNPSHLEVVTRRENVLRGVGITAKRARKTHCPQGHPYSGSNLYQIGRHRQCRTCQKVRDIGRKR